MTRPAPTPRRTAVPADSGFTLIELILAIVLSALIIGVIGAAMVTALNVADSTTDQVGDSTDAGLISSFLVRDAQSVGAIDPTTALSDVTLGAMGVTSDNAAAGWSGCAKPAAFALRFSWIDPNDRTSPVVVYYSLDASRAELTRRLCKGGVTTDLVVGRNITTVVASCVPSCSGTPRSVALALRGSGVRAPFAYTLNASVRYDSQMTPSVANSAAVPLLALGARPAAACPNLTLAGTGAITVRGRALVDASCTGTPLSGNEALLGAAGTVSRIVKLNDPFVGRSAPSFTCPAGGTNPATFGVSATRDTVTVYPQKVTIASGTVVFAPGRYVFCNGLAVSGGQVTGTDVLFYVVADTVTVAAAATVDLTGRSTGVEASMLLWVAAAGQTVQIDGGTRVTSLRGVVYAPTSTVTVTSVKAANIGGVVAKAVSIGGAGTARIGLPLPVVTVLPSVVPLGEVGVVYPPVALAASAGTAPYTWSATTLPAGLAIDPTTGTISGTPTTAGTTVAIITAVDATAQAASFDHSFTINAAMSVAWTALPAAEVGVTYVPTASVASLGTAPYTWTATGLPAGIVINTTTGVVSGTPSAAGTSAVVVTVTDALGAVATQSSSVVVNAALQAPWPTLPRGQVGLAYTATTMTASSGATPYAWSQTGLPTGLVINATSGAVSGTPTAAGTFAAVIRVTDALGATLTKNYSVVVTTALVGPTQAMSNGQVGTSYTVTMVASGGSIPYAWTATGLPPGPRHRGVDRHRLRHAHHGRFVQRHRHGLRCPGRCGEQALLRCHDRRGGVRLSRHDRRLAGGVLRQHHLDGQPGAVSGRRRHRLQLGEWLARSERARRQLLGPLDTVQTFTAGTYTFTMGSDDGSRLLIDGSLVLNAGPTGRSPRERSSSTSRVATTRS